MPILINEFEIIPGPAPKAEAAPTPAKPPQPPAPEEIERVLLRRADRMLRLRAD